MQIVEPIRNKADIERIKKVLKSSNTRDFLLFLLGINSGLRISDILALKVKDVLGKGYLEIKEKKTGKYKRFPISETIQFLLNDFVKDKSLEANVFTRNWHNEPLSRVQVYRIINNACRKAGIVVKVGTHSMRKTFGYHFYREYKDIALLQCIFNHSSPTTTLRYIGINQDMIDCYLRKFSL